MKIQDYKGEKKKKSSKRTLQWSLN